jgi:hypothetical protein
MTPREALELAYGLLGSWGYTVRGMSESVLYDRMSLRQAELFSWVAGIDPEFFGRDVAAPVTSGTVAFTALESAGVRVGHVQSVVVENPGTSGYRAGERVRLVRSDDVRDLPPRVTLRDRVLRSVETDLEGVTSLRVFFSRLPAGITPSGVGTIELPSPFDDLLALDLAKFILTRDLETANSPALAYYVAEEAKRLVALEAHIRGTYRAMETRFTQPVVPQSEPMTRE